MMVNGSALTFALLALLPGASSIGCISDSGSAVDWWVIIKEPDGLNYVYLDAKDQSFKSSDRTLDLGTGALGKTLKQLYGKASVKGRTADIEEVSSEESNIGYALWNDEEPGGKTHGAPSAHAKGALGFNSSSGVWITHSVPKFPNTIDSGYDGSWEIASHTYGQSFLCVSLTKSGVEDVANTMQVDHLSFYDSSLPSGLESAYPEFKALIGKNRTSDDTRTKEIKSKGGETFLRISKSGHWADDGNHFYEGLVAPALKSNLATETWQNGTGSMDDNCKDHYKIMNVRHMTVPGSDGWNSSNDHSKWAMTYSKSTSRTSTTTTMTTSNSSLVQSALSTAVQAPQFIFSAILSHFGYRPSAHLSTPSLRHGRRMKKETADGKKVVCIGDINRQTGQANRGGGTVCLLGLSSVWDSFHKAVDKVESC